VGVEVLLGMMGVHKWEVEEMEVLLQERTVLAVLGVVEDLMQLVQLEEQEDQGQFLVKLEHPLEEEMEGQRQMTKAPEVVEVVLELLQERVNTVLAVVGLEQVDTEVEVLEELAAVVVLKNVYPELAAAAAGIEEGVEDLPSLVVEVVAAAAAAAEVIFQ
jgi:hypothetical protein